jgi:lactoylglutathione lyase
MMPGMKKAEIPFLLPFVAFLLAPTLFAQSRVPDKAPEFDHFAIYIHNLSKSAEFYENVMELAKISEPFKDGMHVWFRIGAHDQLHVVSGATSSTPPDRDIHLAFRVPSLSVFVAHLDQMHVSYGDSKTQGKIKVRPDGVHQIYLQDPDGYWIEVNDSRF